MTFYLHPILVQPFNYLNSYVLFDCFYSENTVAIAGRNDKHLSLVKFWSQVVLVGKEVYVYTKRDVLVLTHT